MLIGRGSDDGAAMGHSTLKILTIHREVLVDQVKNTQCILDNLLSSGFVCNEDVEIIQRSTTKTDQVGSVSQVSGFQSGGLRSRCQGGLSMLEGNNEWNK